MKKQRRGRRQIKNCSAKKKRREKESREELSKVGGSNIKRKGGKQQTEKQRKSKWKNKIQTLQITEGSSQQGKAGRQNESTFQDDS